jgi:hypothetical protein|nr:MAG TPA: hypothetical protein [Caudoviricetes sp.]
MNTVDLIAGLIEAGDHEAAIQAVNELVETASALEREREEMQARIAELEVYEEREMIGDPAGLGGPSISSSLRERDAAQADAENTRYQLDWANERIRDLENDIRSHKRVCPMFQ